MMSKRLTYYPEKELPPRRAAIYLKDIKLNPREPRELTEQEWTAIADSPDVANLEKIGALVIEPLESEAPLENAKIAGNPDAANSEKIEEVVVEQPESETPSADSATSPLPSKSPTTPPKK